MAKFGTAFKQYRMILARYLKVACEDHSPSFRRSVTLEEKIFLPCRQGALCSETEVKFCCSHFQLCSMRGAISFQEGLTVEYKLITEIK